jgi:hypothetical protein
LAYDLSSAHYWLPRVNVEKHRVAQANKPRDTPVSSLEAADKRNRSKSLERAVRVVAVVCSMKA